MSYRVLVVLLAGLGCNGDGDSDTDVGQTDTTPDNCAFAGDFSGAVDVALDFGQAEGCSGSGYDDRLAMSFGIQDTDYAAYVEIGSGAVAGETATGLPAAVELADLSVGYDGWRTPEDGCTVDITEVRPDDFFGWIVIGSGQCTELATGDDVTGELTIGPFTFSAVASYPE